MQRKRKEAFILFGFDVVEKEVQRILKKSPAIDRRPFYTKLSTHTHTHTQSNKSGRTFFTKFVRSAPRPVLLVSVLPCARDSAGYFYCKQTPENNNKDNNATAKLYTTTKTTTTTGNAFRAIPVLLACLLPCLAPHLFQITTGSATFFFFFLTLLICTKPGRVSQRVFILALFSSFVATMMQQHHGAFRICDAQQEIIIACSTADTVSNRETVNRRGDRINTEWHACNIAR